MAKKKKQHNNILKYPGKIVDGKEISGLEYFKFQCRGCTIGNRELLWNNYINSIIGWGEEDNSYFIFEDEPENKFDPNAIKVVVRGEFFGTAGYVGREYTAEVKQILQKCSLYRIDIFSGKPGDREITLMVRWKKKEEPQNA